MRSSISEYQCDLPFETENALFTEQVRIACLQFAMETIIAVSSYVASKNAIFKSEWECVFNFVSESFYLASENCR